MGRGLRFESQLNLTARCLWTNNYLTSLCFSSHNYQMGIKVIPHRAAVGLSEIMPIKYLAQCLANKRHYYYKQYALI